MSSIIEEAFKNDIWITDRYDDAFAPEWSNYKQALARVEALDPERFGDSGITPLSLMDEAVVVLMNAAWHAGVRVGQAFGRAERSVDAPYRTCDHCQGYGRLRRGDVAGEACGRCGGVGVVPREDGE